MPEQQVRESGYLTPDNVPDERLCRSFSIPNDTAWLGTFMGALAPLLLEQAWRPYGELTPQECADEWQNIFFSFQTACATNIPTPYWDEDEDVDDEMTPEEQIWYGEVEDPSAAPDELTFIEKASVIAFTGILAIATAEVGFAPAIAFATIAPKMILAVRNGDAGRIIRIFIDGAKAYEGEDTGDNSITEVIIAGDEELSEHQIYITSGAA